MSVVHSCLLALTLLHDGTFNVFQTQLSVNPLAIHAVVREDDAWSPRLRGAFGIVDHPVELFLWCVCVDTAQSYVGPHYGRAYDEDVLKREEACHVGGDAVGCSITIANNRQWKTPNFKSVYHTHCERFLVVPTPHY